MRREMQRTEAVVHPDDQHRIGVSVTDATQAFADRDGAARACRCDGVGLSEESVSTAEDPGDGIRGSIDGEARRHPAPTGLSQRAGCLRHRVDRP